MLFETQKLNPKLLLALKDSGFDEMMEIQEKCIPPLLDGRDLVGQSMTGSGKTLAFGLPILDKAHAGKGLQALILTPTRELCVQVNGVMNDYGKYVGIRSIGVFGGVSIGPQINEIRGTEIVVGTPGRILDHLSRGTISFSNVKFLVLDEADKMFEMGFIDDVERIISKVPKARQTMLFSATIPKEVHRLVKKHLINPVDAKGEVFVDKSLLKQLYYEVGENEKFSLLVHLLNENPKGLSLIFCGTRREVDIVARNLSKQGIDAKAIHGGHEQNKRLKALDALRQGHIAVLVATDVAARGLDIKNVNHVYNYDVPKTTDEYIHRIGRTARAGADGTAITILTLRDHSNFRNVMRSGEVEVQRADTPQFASVPFSRHSESERGHFGHGGFNRHGPGAGRGFGGYRGSSGHRQGESRDGQQSNRGSGSFRGKGRGGRPSYGFGSRGGSSRH